MGPAHDRSVRARPRTPTGGGASTVESVSAPAPGFVRTLLRDIEANTQLQARPLVVVGALLGSRGTQAVLLYRIAHWCHLRGLTPLSEILVRISQFVFSVDLHYQARIGPGLALRHGYGVIVGSMVVLGEDVVLHQNVTIGKRAAKWSRRPDGMATVGDRVAVRAGAVLAGPIVVGDDAEIGANCVVAVDVPAGALVTAPKPEIRLFDESRASAV